MWRGGQSRRRQDPDGTVSDAWRAKAIRGPGWRGRRLLAARTNDVAQLCEMAFQIATDPQIAKRDFALASAALDQAEKLPPTDSTRVAVTRAVVLFESGKQEEGLARARQAVLPPGTRRKGPCRDLPPHHGSALRGGENQPNHANHHVRPETNQINKPAAKP